MDPFNLFKDTKEIRPPSSLFSTNLGRPKHERGDIHWIGEALPAPGSVATSGEATPGASAIPAREDHFHGAITTVVDYSEYYLDEFVDLADWLGTTNWSIDAGRARKTALGNTHMILDIEMPVNDITVQGSLLSASHLSSATTVGYVTGRSNYARTSYYYAGWYSNFGWRLGGTGSVGVLDSVAASVPSGDVVLKLEFIGNTINFYVDGVLTLTAVDGTYKGPSYRWGGLYGSTGFTGEYIYFDDFSIETNEGSNEAQIVGVLRASGFTSDVIEDSVTGAYELDLFYGGVGAYVLTLTGNTTISFLRPPPDNEFFSLDILVSGAFTLTWPTIKWPGGIIPTYTSISKYKLATYDGGATWYGEQLGSAYA